VFFINNLRNCRG